MIHFHVKLWEEVQLDVLVYDLVSNSYGSALGIGERIQLGDKVKLKINQKSGSAVVITEEYK